MTEFENWKNGLLDKLKVKKTQPETKKEHLPFIWQVTSTIKSKISRERAEKLAIAGEQVSPNPFCNWNKWGLEDPTLVD